MIRWEPQECTSRPIYIFYQKQPRLFLLLGPVSRFTLLCPVPTQIHCRIDTNTSAYLHKYISVFSHGCGSPVPGYINNGLATHDEREMPRHISSYCGANCTNIPNMRLHIRAGRVCAYTRARDGGVYGWWWRGELGGGSIRTGRSRSRPPLLHWVWKPLFWWQIYAGVMLVIVVVKSAY